MRRSPPCLRQRRWGCRDWRSQNWWAFVGLPLADYLWVTYGVTEGAP